MIVLPSRSVDRWNEHPAETRAYEERLLGFLLQLRDPGLQLIYVTSVPVDPATVAYYLSMVPPTARRDARRRLELVAVGDPTARPLTEKLLERPDLVRHIRRLIRHPVRSHLLPFNATVLERDLALALGVPMYGADPMHTRLGTKSAARELFADAGVEHPLGVEHIHDVADVSRAIRHIRAVKPGLNAVVLKLNQGVSGEGNAIIDLTGLPAPGTPADAPAIETRVGALVPEAPGITSARFLSKLAAHGGVVEELIAGQELRSPSVQCEISPAAEVEILSTHEQIMGGRGGHTYTGCRFPAGADYAAAIAVQARRVAVELARRGVIGRLAIDFVVVRDSGGQWHPFALEVNLRMGATTHPFQTLVQLTGGRYDSARARLITPGLGTRAYVSTDHLDTPRLCRLGRRGVLQLAHAGPLRFDPIRNVGPVFHMLSCVNELGHVGVTTIGESAAHANELFADVRAILTRAGAAAGGRDAHARLRAPRRAAGGPALAAIR